MLASTCCCSALCLEWWGGYTMQWGCQDECLRRLGISIFHLFPLVPSFTLQGWGLGEWWLNSNESGDSHSGGIPFIHTYNLKFQIIIISESRLHAADGGGLTSLSPVLQCLTPLTPLTDECWTPAGMQQRESNRNVISEFVLDLSFSPFLKIGNSRLSF